MLKCFKRNILVLFILFLSLIVNIGAIFYYLYELNGFSYFSILILSILGLIIFFYFITYRDYQQELKNIKRGKIKIIDIILFFLSLLLFSSLIYILFTSSSSLAIVSPWHFLPPYFFVILSAFLSLVFYGLYLRSYFSKILTLFLYFLFLAISFFIYQIAFGYDQLLHQRALSEILQFGLISPKTFYYIGQYSLEFFLIKSLPFGLEAISRGLVPFLSAVLIPLSFLFNFKNKNKNIYFILVLFLLLPFSIFTYTVPQNLAFLFLTLIIIFSFNDDFIKRKGGFLFLFSLALSSFFVHPLAGIPAVIFVFILLLSTINLINKESFWKKVSPYKWFSSKTAIKGDGLHLVIPVKTEVPWNLIKRVMIILAYIAQVLILPVLLLFVGGKLSWPKLNFDFLIPRILGQENVFLNFLYFLFFNKFFIFLILIILAIYLFAKKYKFKNIYLLSFFTLFLSYISSLFVSFPFLSNIDKSSYSNRILIIALLFLIPAFYNLFSDLIDRVKTKNFYFRFYLAIFSLLFLLASLYLNYPRKDNYFNSRAYSVSISDFEAVKLIEEIKINDNYIVLANQQVGAAAIKELGFKRYYGDWFYYSVQTGGLLYDYYLKILDNPSRELISDLLSQIEADNAYVVVNDYWWAYDRIVNELKVEADNYYEIDGGKIFIFHFDLKK